MVLLASSVYTIGFSKSHESAAFQVLFLILFVILLCACIVALSFWTL